MWVDGGFVPKGELCTKCDGRGSESRGITVRHADGSVCDTRDVVCVLCTLCGGTGRATKKKAPVYLSPALRWVLQASRIAARIRRSRIRR